MITTAKPISNVYSVDLFYDVNYHIFRYKYDKNRCRWLNCLLF